MNRLLWRCVRGAHRSLWVCLASLAAGGACTGELGESDGSGLPRVCGAMAAQDSVTVAAKSTREVLRSCSGDFALIADANEGAAALRLWAGAAVLWQSCRPSTAAAAVARIELRGDGNFVALDARGAVLFESATGGHPGARARLGDDGDLVVEAPSSRGALALWSTNTAGARSNGGSCEQ